MGLEVNKVKYFKEWPLVRLKELCNRISDGTHFTPTYVSEGIPFISVKDIYNDKVHFNKCKYITAEAHAELIKRCFPEKDDILITKSGTIGRMALVPETPEFSLFVSVALIKNKKDLILSKFLKFCLENFLNSINISQDIKGGLLKNFHLEDIRETLIPVLSLAEQQKIVLKIEELFSELDKGVEALKTAQQQLKIYRQSVLKHAFEGKLTNPFLKGGELPEGWTWVHPVDVALKEKYSIGIGPFGSNLKTSDYTTEGFPLIFVKNITRNNFDLDKRFISKEKFKELAAHQVKPGDILITKMGDPPGDCTIYPMDKGGAVLTADCLKIRVDEDVANRKFILYSFKSQGFKKQIEGLTIGVAQKKISVERFKSITFLLPPLEEQHRIVQEIESRLSVCDKLEETIADGLLKAETLRQSILKRAFEGKLVPQHTVPAPTLLKDVAEKGRAVQVEMF